MKASQRVLFPIALALGVAAGASFAEGPLQGPTLQEEPLQFTSTEVQSDTTRSQVQSPVVGLEQAGLIERGEATAPEHQARSNSYLSRAYVQAEAQEAYRMGLVAQGELMPVPTEEQLQQMQFAAARSVQSQNLALSPMEREAFMN